MSKNNHLSQLDHNQMIQRKFDESQDADRVVIVGGAIDIKVDDNKIANAVKEGLKNIRIDSQQHEPIIQIVEKIVYKEIEKPVIVKEIEYREIEVPRILEKIVYKEIEKPFIVEHTVQKSSEPAIQVIDLKESKVSKIHKLIQTIVLIGLLLVAIFK